MRIPHEAIKRLSKQARCGEISVIHKIFKPRRRTLQEAAAGGGSGGEAETFAVQLFRPADPNVAVDNYFEPHLPQQGSDEDENSCDDASSRKAQCDELFEGKITNFPYYADLWPSSHALSQHLIDNAAQIFGGGTSTPTSHSNNNSNNNNNNEGGKNVIELGSGLGLCGMVVGALRQRQQSAAGRFPMIRRIVFSDYNVHALRFCELSWKLNFVRQDDSEDEDLKARNEDETVDFVHLDWENPQASNLKPNSFDVIIASDVIYENSSHQALLNTIEYLGHAGTHVYLSEPNRLHASEFLDMCRRSGFTIETCAEEVYAATVNVNSNNNNDNNDTESNSSSSSSSSSAYSAMSSSPDFYPLSAQKQVHKVFIHHIFKKTS